MSVAHSKPLNVVGLFAGIGGFELGLSRSGHNASVMCEIDYAAKAVLKTHFPNAKFVHDIRDINLLPKSTSLVTAGFPCQDLSSSGLKGGINGNRSSLISEVFRILELNSVEWVLFENVHFMLHLNKGEGIRTVVEGLERLGYNWAYRVLDTQSFGIPQRRKRVFILASRGQDPRHVLLSEDGLSSVSEKVSVSKPIGFYWTEGTYSTGIATNVIPPLKGGSAIGIPSPPAILMPDGFVGTPNIRDAERFQGFPANWTKPVEKDHKKSLRWRLVGNAVSVDVAEWLGEKLVFPKEYNWRNDQVLSGEKWPNAAWNMGQGRYVSEASMSPVDRYTYCLSKFLIHDLKPLSERATRGFLNRARKGRLNFPDGFLDHLNSHLSNMSKLSQTND